MEKDTWRYENKLPVAIRRKTTPELAAVYKTLSSNKGNFHDKEQTYKQAIEAAEASPYYKEIVTGLWYSTLDGRYLMGGETGKHFFRNTCRNMKPAAVAQFMTVFKNGKWQSLSDAYPHLSNNQNQTTMGYKKVPNTPTNLPSRITDKEFNELSTDQKGYYTYDIENSGTAGPVGKGEQPSENEEKEEAGNQESDNGEKEAKEDTLKEEAAGSGSQETGDHEQKVEEEQAQLPKGEDKVKDPEDLSKTVGSGTTNGPEQTATVKETIPPTEEIADQKTE